MSDYDDSSVRNAGPTSFTYTGHNDNVFCVAFSPDGRYIASGSRDTTVRIWQIVGAPFMAPTSPLSLSNVGVINYAPTMPIEFADRLVYRQHSSSLLSVAWSPDGRFLASGDTGGVVNVWDASCGETFLTYHGHTRFVRGISWSPDGRQIASGGDYGDSTVQVWEALTGRLVRKHTRQYRIFAVGWGPDSSLIASCSFDGSVEIWDAFTGELSLAYKEHSGPVYAAAWSPEGGFIASGGQDALVRVWDALTGKTVSTYRGHTKAVKTLAWSPDGRYVVSGGDDQALQIWQAGTGEHVALYTGYTKWIRSLAWSPDGNYIASASGKTVQIHEFERPQPVLSS